ncbi:MAG: hypothetical protein U5R46_01860 [Gammaproteobacteria bacterium]|nr:hypothetical protein [Gammaproteobacteria bacterium]
MKSSLSLVVAAAAAIAGNNAFADPVSVEVLLTPQEQMKFEFADGSNHFVLAVRREGEAEGSGVFDGAAVTEFGWHDVNPPISGDPRGYLQITTENGDVAVLSWTVKAVFMKGEDGPALFDNGVWELVSGTGQFENKRGVGSLVIVPRGGPNLFILDGEVGDRP